MLSRHLQPVTVVTLALYNVDDMDARVREIDDMVDRWADDWGIRLVVTKETRMVPR